MFLKQITWILSLLVISVPVIAAKFPVHTDPPMTEKDFMALTHFEGRIKIDQSPGGPWVLLAPETIQVKMGDFPFTGGKVTPTVHAKFMYQPTSDVVWIASAAFECTERAVEIYDFACLDMKTGLLHIYTSRITKQSEFSTRPLVGMLGKILCRDFIENR